MTWLCKLKIVVRRSFSIHLGAIFIANKYQSSCKMTNSLDENKSTPNGGAAAILDSAAIATAQENEKAVFKIFAQTFQFFKTDEVMLSFNGGKDCTVLLHMLAKFYQNSCLKHKRVPVLYIQSEDSFDEVEDFVKDIQNNYDIDFTVRKGCIKKALIGICAESPKLKAVFMGSRRTDPYCEKLLVMQATDSDWPPLMRINPILDWSCRDVWQYTFANKVPYCSLYNRGYTSLGSKSRTLPNPHLKVFDHETGIVSYRPAYELMDDSLERAGRT